MSRYSLILLAALCSGGTASAANWAEATFDELSKDFGSVARGPTLQHPFRVKNNTKSDLTIASVRVSCNVCSAVSALKSTLKPGEETAVVGKMFTDRFVGPKTITIFVQFSQPAWEEVRLVMQANARDDVAVSPETVAVGQVRRGSTPTSKVTVTLLGNRETKVTGVQSESNYIQTTIKETKRSDTEVSYELSAKVRSDIPVGKWYTDLWVKTNNAEMPRVRVPLTVEIESPLSVSPSSVNLGQVALKAEAERKVIIRGAKPFKIIMIQGADDNLTVTDSTAESTAVHVLTVKLKGAKPGDLNRTLKVVTDLMEEGDVQFTAKAKVMPER